MRFHQARVPDNDSTEPKVNQFQGTGRTFPNRTAATSTNSPATTELGETGYSPSLGLFRMARQYILLSSNSDWGRHNGPQSKDGHDAQRGC